MGFMHIPHAMLVEDCGKRLELPNRLMMGHAVEKVQGGSLPLGNSV